MARPLFHQHTTAVTCFCFNEMRASPVAVATYSAPYRILDLAQIIPTSVMGIVSPALQGLKGARRSPSIRTAFSPYSFWSAPADCDLNRFGPVGCSFCFRQVVQ